MDDRVWRVVATLWCAPRPAQVPVLAAEPPSVVGALGDVIDDAGDGEALPPLEVLDGVDESLVEVVRLTAEVPRLPSQVLRRRLVDFYKSVQRNGPG